MKLPDTPAPISSAATASARVKILNRLQFKHICVGTCLVVAAAMPIVVGPTLFQKYSNWQKQRALTAHLNAVDEDDRRASQELLNQHNELNSARRTEARAEVVKWRQKLAPLVDPILRSPSARNGLSLDEFLRRAENQRRVLNVLMASKTFQEGLNGSGLSSLAVKKAIGIEKFGFFNVLSWSAGRKSEAFGENPFQGSAPAAYRKSETQNPLSGVTPKAFKDTSVFVSETESKSLAGKQAAIVDNAIWKALVELATKVSVHDLLKKPKRFRVTEQAVPWVVLSGQFGDSRREPGSIYLTFKIKDNDKPVDVWFMAGLTDPQVTAEFGDPGPFGIRPGDLSKLPADYSKTVTIAALVDDVGGMFTPPTLTLLNYRIEP